MNKYFKALIIFSIVTVFARDAKTQNYYVCKDSQNNTVLADHIIDSSCIQSKVQSSPTYSAPESKSSQRANLKEPPKDKPKSTKADIFSGVNVKKESYNVTRIIDGDTIEINYRNEKARVRLIGIDCPEKTQEWGDKAAEYTASKVNGKQIDIEFDIQTHDQYSRLLGYVYIGPEMLNEELVKKGLAVVATYPPNVKYVELFKKAQEYARNKKEGFWFYGGLTKTPYEYRKKQR